LAEPTLADRPVILAISRKSKAFFAKYTRIIGEGTIPATGLDCKDPVRYMEDRSRPTVDLG